MRRRELIGVVGATAIGVLSVSSPRCDAFVARSAMPKRRNIMHDNNRGGAASLRASWIDEQVSIELPASSEDAYSVYSDLRRQPEWSPWLKSVEHDRESGASKWVIQSKGIRVAWKAQNNVEVYGSEVAWSSTTGLNNRGRVTFEDQGEGRCLMTLTLSYNLPFVIASVLKIDAIERFVKRTILSDLARFKHVLVRQLEASGRASSTTANTPSSRSSPSPVPAVAAGDRHGPAGADPGTAAAAAATASSPPATAVTADSPSSGVIRGTAAADPPGASTGTATNTATANATGTATGTAATTSTTAAAAAERSGALGVIGAPVEATSGSAAGGGAGPGREVESGGAGEGEGEGKASHTPGRRALWRRRIRRLLRRDAVP